MKTVDKIKFRWYLNRAKFYYRQYDLYSNMDKFLSDKNPPYSNMLVALAGQVRYNMLKYEKKLNTALEKCEQIADKE